ncbi:hypothetical protein EV182_003344, partial [Spiromyces aspiralis]
GFASTARLLKKKVAFPGALGSEFTHKLQFTGATTPIPTYQLVDVEGKILDKDNEPKVSKEEAQRIYKLILTLSVMDQVLYEAQRQGRISFYMTSFGEEAIIGSAAALDPQDTVFGQYREAGVLLYRGFGLENFMNQCFSNALDLGKGRQMPVHYGSKEHRFHTISSPLATQLPQAAGAAYAIRRSRSNKCVICYFGEGAASEGDFHASLNMAATLDCPIIFYCRNNGYAISTPSVEQYKGDGIASRGIGYGIDTIRVDGNDLWGVYAATRRARELAVTHSKPVLIEAMTYRVGHHSTSDDSLAYRPKKEIEDWSRHDNPIMRMRRWLTRKGWWNDDDDTAAKREAREAVLSAFSKAEAVKKPAISNLFSDVYDTLPANLQDQKQEVMDLVAKYPDYYRIHDFAKE